MPGKFVTITSDHCLVRISEADEDRKPSDTGDAEFTIISPEVDSLTLISPNGREILTAGSSHDITWTSTGTVGNIKIQYSGDGGETWTMIADSAENDGGFTWVVPDAASGHCLVKINENDEDGTPVDASEKSGDRQDFHYCQRFIEFPRRELSGRKNLFVLFSAKKLKMSIRISCFGI